MQKRFILFPLLTVVALVAFVAISLTVFAVGVDAATAPSEEMTRLETIEVAPVQAEPVVIESQVKYESYSGHGCAGAHSVKMQLTNKGQQETIETSEAQLLTQAK